MQRRQVDNRTARTILSLIILGAICAVLAQLVNFGSKELDQRVDNLLLSIGISVMGVVFMVMRKKNIGSYAAESFEILFFIIPPLVVFITILGDPNLHFAFFFPVYYGTLISWLLLSEHYIFNSIDNEEQRQSWSGIKRLWAGLMIISILIFPLYFIWLENLHSKN